MAWTTREIINGKWVERTVEPDVPGHGILGNLDDGRTVEQMRRDALLERVVLTKRNADEQQSRAVAVGLGESYESVAQYAAWRAMIQAAGILGLDAAELESDVYRLAAELAEFER